MKKTSRRITGDLISTHFGISGSAILKLLETDFESAMLVIDLIGISESEFYNLSKIKTTSKDYIKSLQLQ